MRDEQAAALGAFERLGPKGVRVTIQSEASQAQHLAEARQKMAGERLDINHGTAGPSRKKLLFADMDSTIITVECIDEIARVAGVGDQVAAITEKAMRGEIDFQVALRKRVALLKGFAVVKLQEIFDTRIELAPGAETMVRTMRSWGAKTALISGGFTFFSERVALLAGFHSHRANTLEEKDGLLTGNPIDPLLGPDAKLAAFNEGVAAKNTTADQALAIGDGANDLPMIKAAGLGVAYRAKPAVVKAADACLDFSDLTAVLHLQGVFSRDFIS